MRLPAEYEPQSAVWLTWPGNPLTWPDCREAALRQYAHFAKVVSQFQVVEMICCAAWQPEAFGYLREAGADLTQFCFHDWPVNDAWCRDHGPLFVKADDGSRAVIDFRYNAWGGKFSPWEDDDAVAGRVAGLRGLPSRRLGITGEGGALEVNSQGLLITTDCVWLNENRNPGWTHAEAENFFAEVLGGKETLWLPQGLIGDDTDGHIDTITRFVSDGRVVTAMCVEQDDNYPVLAANRERLAARLEVVDLPHPAPLLKDGERLPATYANFLILNDAVLVPTYAQPKRDDQALGVLREQFSDRDVVGVPSEILIREGGSLHCLSMQEGL